MKLLRFRPPLGPLGFKNNTALFDYNVINYPADFFKNQPKIALYVVSQTMHTPLRNTFSPAIPTGTTPVHIPTSIHKNMYRLSPWERAAENVSTLSGISSVLEKTPAPFLGFGFIATPYTL